VSSCYYMCPYTSVYVLILLYMCPHTTMYGSSFWYMFRLTAEVQALKTQFAANGRVEEEERELLAKLNLSTERLTQPEPRVEEEEERELRAGLESQLTLEGGEGREAGEEQHTCELEALRHRLADAQQREAQAQQQQLEMRARIVAQQLQVD
jgi:hypothetical protein